MTGYTWLNAASLALGLLAWVLAAAALLRSHRGTGPLPAASLAACALSPCLVVFYLGHLTDRSDWSALMDVMRAFRLSAALLLGGTLALNAAAWVRRLVTTRKGEKG